MDDVLWFQKKIVTGLGRIDNDDGAQGGIPNLS